VAVGAEKLQVLGAVVKPVAIFVVDVENQRFVDPLIAQGAALALASIFASGIQQRPP
jgi:hypothetical protein